MNCLLPLFALLCVAAGPAVARFPRAYNHVGSTTCAVSSQILPGVPIPVAPPLTARQLAAQQAALHPGPSIPAKGATRLMASPLAIVQPLTNSVMVGPALIVAWNPVTNAANYFVAIGTDTISTVATSLALTNLPPEPFSISVSAGAFGKQWPSSSLVFNGLTMTLTNRLPELLWLGTATNTYSVQYSSTLPAHWTNLLTLTNPAGICRVSGALRQGFYRIQITP